MLLTNASDYTITEQTPDVVKALVGAMCVYDTEMTQHLMATSVLCARVAIRLDLDAQTVENCRLAALLHDVGMLGVDPAIIACPGMLADAEWELLAEHPALGGELLSRVPSLVHLSLIHI